MKKRKSRNFSIASAGRDLFNGLYYEYTDTSFSVPQNKRCMRSIIYNLFSSDYDDLLEKNNLHLRKASYCLLSCLKNQIVPEYINNSILNIILDIVYHKTGMRKKKEMAKMYHYYFDLAKIAYKNNDHNTTLVIKCALEHIVIARFKFKLLKSEKKLLNDFKENYGMFLDCYKNHVKYILDNKNNLDSFVPSAMVLDMHLKKNKAYTKAFKNIGKYPDELVKHQRELNSVSLQIKEYYHNFPNAIINLYTDNPFDHPFVYTNNNNQMIGDLLDATKNIR